VEQRTRLGGQAQQRLAARKEAAKRGVETRRRNREAREQVNVATQVPKPQVAEPTMATGHTKRAASDVVQAKRALPGGQVSAMATVALRGEQAARFRALAAKQGLSLAKLLVRMLEVFETRGE